VELGAQKQFLVLICFFPLDPSPREGYCCRNQKKEEAKNYNYLILEDRLLSEWDTVGYSVHVASTHLDSKAIPDFIWASSSA
jgi:hypothetical protein